MTAFLARTWFIWWTVAVLVIMRWFQVATHNDGSTVSSLNDISLEVVHPKLTIPESNVAPSRKRALGFEL
jgi:hypothetical protein